MCLARWTSSRAVSLTLADIGFDMMGCDCFGPVEGSVSLIGVGQSGMTGPVCNVDGVVTLEVQSTVFNQELRLFVR